MWSHTGVQVIDGLTTTAQATHLSPAEHRALSTATGHLQTALAANPGS